MYLCVYLSMNSHSKMAEKDYFSLFFTQKGGSALMLAASEGYLGVVQVLVKAAANLDLQSNV